MNRFSRPLLAASAIAVALMAATRAPHALETPVTLGVAMLAFGVVLWAGSAAGRDLPSLLEAVRGAERGEPLPVPPDAEEGTRRAFEALAQAATTRRLAQEADVARAEAFVEEHDTLSETVEKAVSVLEDQAMRSSDLVKSVNELLRICREGEARVQRGADLLGQVEVARDDLRNQLDGQARSVGELVPVLTTWLGAGRSQGAALAAGRQRLEALREVTEEARDALADAASGAVDTERRLATARGHAEAAAKEAERGEQALATTLEELGRLRTATAETAEILASLERRTEAIGQIVSVIDDVGEQTNLLALNAAIIAAQAGEQGRGFAVIAKEIKELADRASSSTREISELVRTVQAESKNASNSVDRGSVRLERGLVAGAESRQVLRRIRETSIGAFEGLNDVARATEDQERERRRAEVQIDKVSAALRGHAEGTADLVAGQAESVRAADRATEAGKELERGLTNLDRAFARTGDPVALLRSHLGDLTGSERALVARGEEVLRSAERASELSRSEQATFDRVSGLVLRLRDHVPHHKTAKATGRRRRRE